MAVSEPRALTTWHRRALAAVATWPWLATLTDRVAEKALPVYDRHRDDLVVELMHGGRWAGHSLHAALSDLPIGFWAGTVVLDAVGRDGDGKGLDAAGTLTAAGLAAAAATVATGATDWTVSDGEDRRVGLFHGLLNLAATALQAASLVARVAGHRRPAQALGLAGTAVVGAAGYLGGHLVQGRAVMVNRTATTSGPTRWVRAVEEAELEPGASTGAVVDGRQVLLHRTATEVHAVDDLCSHAGALLSRGEIVDCVVTCPLHGSRFDVRDGRIVRGPAHHPQPVLPTRVRNGWIEVRGAAPRRGGRGPRRTAMAWEAVADLDQLEEGDAMLVELGEPVCVVRLYEDEAVAVHNTCTHQQQPLNEGYLQEDDTLICPAHNSCFDLRTGEPRGVPAVAPIPVYACKIEDGAIWVDMDQQRGDAPIPHRPYH